jgi:hypothetical protein
MHDKNKLSYQDYQKYEQKLSIFTNGMKKILCAFNLIFS